MLSVCRSVVLGRKVGGGMGFRYFFYFMGGEVLCEFEFWIQCVGSRK